jgi:hypothetical protein
VQDVRAGGSKLLLGTVIDVAPCASEVDIRLGFRLGFRLGCRLGFTVIDVAPCASEVDIL